MIWIILYIIILYYQEEDIDCANDDGDSDTDGEDDDNDSDTDGEDDADDGDTDVEDDDNELINALKNILNN